MTEKADWEKGKVDEWQKDYLVCRVCNEPVSFEDFEWACKRYEQQVCSTECRQRETIQRFGCCEKAQFTPCVCMYSFDCPDHGSTHVGTHD